MRLATALAPVVACCFSLPAQQPVQTEPLHVTVLGPDGKPRPGAVVEILRYEGKDAGYINLDLTDGAGCRVVSKLPTAKGGTIAIQVPVALSYRIRVDVPPYAIEHRHNIYAGEEITIQLRPGATLAGVVSRDDGVPMAGAAVRAIQKRKGDRIPAVPTPTVTDAKGSFRLERLMPGRTTLHVDPTEGSVPRWSPLQLPAGEVTKLDIVVAKGALLQGRIVDAATDKPVAGAEVGVGWTFYKSVRTDRDGRYRLQGIGGPFANNIFARAPGYGRYQIQRPDKTEGTITRDLQLHKGFELSGRILDIDGKPVAGCYVAGVGMTHDGTNQETDWLSARTDAAGRYRIVGLRAELDTVLLTRHHLRATVVLPVPESVDGKPVVMKDVTLRDRRIVRGRLVDRAGEPIVGQALALKGCNNDAPAHLLGAGRDVSTILTTYLASRRATTDSSGRFFFGDLAAGSYTVTLDESTYEVEVKPDVDPDPIQLTR